MKRAALLLLLCGCDREFIVLAPRDGGSAVVDASDSAPAEASVDAKVDGSGDATAADPPPETIRSVGAQLHTCAVDELGVACWGDRQQGQFGTAGGGAALSPVRIATGDFVSVCNGEEHACALRADGAALCWGSNRFGQCANSDRSPREQPTQVPNLRFASIACGGWISCAITTEGELYCWGDNKEGTLGQGDTPNLGDSDVPLRVARELKVKSVSVGQAHACMIETTGVLSCWGRNTLLQAGGAQSIQLRSPRLVEPQRSYEAVAAAQNHTCALASGALYCWGEGARFSPGGAASTSTPVQLGSDRDYQQVAANWFHICAIKRSGALYCWGRNLEYQLGTGDQVERAQPTRVTQHSDYRAVAVGQFHTCAVRSSGLFCWGDNRQGQIGTGSAGGEHWLPERVVVRTATSR